MDTEGRAHTAQCCWLKSKHSYKAVESVSAAAYAVNEHSFLSLSHSVDRHSHFGIFQLVSFSNAHYKHIQPAKVTLRLLMTRMCEIPCHVPTNSRQWCESHCLFFDNCSLARNAFLALFLSLFLICLCFL